MYSNAAATVPLVQQYRCYRKELYTRYIMYHTAVCQQYRYYTSYSVVSYLQVEPDEGDRDAVHEPDPGQATSSAGGEVLEE